MTQLQYPAITAGVDITDALLTSMLPIWLVKTGDTTRQNNTMADDPELTITLAANATYFIEVFVRYCTQTTQGIRSSWTMPSGASAIRGINALGSTQTSRDNASGQWNGQQSTAIVTLGHANSTTNQCFLMESGVLTTTNSGTWAFAWAQVTTTAANTTVNSGSCVRISRLA